MSVTRFTSCTMNGLHANWRLLNPFSIIKQFDQWFDFECRVHGLKDAPQITMHGFTLEVH